MMSVSVDHLLQGVDLNDRRSIAPAQPHGNVAFGWCKHAAIAHVLCTFSHILGELALINDPSLSIELVANLDEGAQQQGCGQRRLVKIQTA